MKIEYMVALTLAAIAIGFFSTTLTWKFGKNLANNNYNNPVLAWIFAIILFLVGLFFIVEGNLIAFILCMPILFFITIKISQNLPYSQFSNSGTLSRKSVVQKIGSSIGMILVYIITHHLFGFGIAEASIPAIITAFILSRLDYTA